MTAKIFRCVCLTLLLSFLILQSQRTAAQVNRYWIDSAGGTWDGTTNWSAAAGGAGGASEPGTLDKAFFTLNNTYTVTGANGDFISSLNFQNGNVTFDFGGGTLIANDTLAAVVVGGVAGQTGRFTVFDGTLAFDTAADEIDVGLAGTGHLTVTTGGVLGTASARPLLTVGAGSVTVNGNGALNLDSLTTIESSSSASINVTGPQAVLGTASTTWIGTSGTGSLTVSSGGTVTTGSDILVGSAATANGTATISGAGSSWTVGGVATVGNLGAGELLVSNGGFFSTGGNFNLGLVAGSRGELTVTGLAARTSIGGSTLIGSSGEGEVTVSAGGQVNAAAVTLASAAFSSGRLSVTGSGSEWNSSGALTIGGPINSSGVVQVTSGGHLSASSLAAGATGFGSIVVDGVGSRLSVSGNAALPLASIGSLGAAPLEVRNGGTVSIGGNLSPSIAAGSTRIRGGSVYVSGSFIAPTGVLEFHDGLLRVGGAFQPRSSAGMFSVNGADQDDLPTLELVGNAAVTNINSLTVGDMRGGRLELRHGRAMSITGNVAIGAKPGSNGAIVIESGASLIADVVNVGGDIGVIGGAGLLEVGPGGLLQSNGLFTLSEGRVVLRGGTIRTDFLGVSGSRFDWTTGTVEFDATDTVFFANFLGDDATLWAGQVVRTSALGQTVRLQQPVIIDGGDFTPGIIDSRSTLVIRAGEAVAQSNALNTGLVLLDSPLARFGAVGGTGTLNSGVVRGTGSIIAPFSNALDGEVEAVTGDRLDFHGSLFNSGRVSMIGGEIVVRGAATNQSSTGLVALRDGTARFDGGLTNNGSIGVTFGTSDVFGDIANTSTGQINISGGAQVTFYDDVVQNGSMVIAAVGPTRSAAVFFGSLTGTGGFVGGGDLYSFGDLRPGASPGSVTMGGNVFMGGTATTEIELGGLGAGQFDQLLVSGNLSLGGSLVVEPWNGFTPGPNQEFLIADVAGIRSGQFLGLGEGSLVGNIGGEDLFITYVAGDGNDVALFTSAVGLPGDFDFDGDVDGRDFLIWQRNPTVGDLADWQGNYGAGPLVAESVAVPEPTGFLLTVAGLVISMWRSASTREGRGVNTIRLHWPTK